MAPHRLRLTVAADGTPSLVVAPVVSGDMALRTAALFPVAMDSANPFCWWKTTHRTHYDDALAWAKTHAVDEPLLLNERGEVTEGARTSVWIEREGQLFTPPLSSGGLAGVHRPPHNTTVPGAVEAVLTPAAMHTDDRVLIGNAAGDLIAAANTALVELGYDPQLQMGADDATAFAGGRAMLRLGASRMGVTDAASEALVEAGYPRLLDAYGRDIDRHTTLYPGAVEAVLTPDDLHTADRVLLGNAVRGLQEVEVVEVAAASLSGR